MKQPWGDRDDLTRAEAAQSSRSLPEISGALEVEDSRYVGGVMIFGADFRPEIIVVFRNDDVSALSDVEHEGAVAEILGKYQCRQTIGVIPWCEMGNWHEPDSRGVMPLGANHALVDFLAQYISESDSEIALHGLTHRTNRFSCPMRREFFEFERLPIQEQVVMIARGTAEIARIFEVRPFTFIPPWNRLDRNTIIACLVSGYRVISAGPYAPTTGDLKSLGMNCNLQR